jgi:hypothetical protein
LQHRLENSHKKKVMLQIRIGDGIIKLENGNPLVGKAAAHTLAMTDEFLKCADQRFGKEDVLWYLMTDSETVKQRTLQKYGAKNLVLNTGGRATMYTSYSTLLPKQAEGEEERKEGEDPMLAVMGELWLGTFCDEFILSHQSGLGRQAALRAHRIPAYLYYGGIVGWQKCYKVRTVLTMTDWSEI